MPAPDFSPSLTTITSPTSPWCASFGPTSFFLEGFEWSTSENILFIGETVPPLYKVSLREALRAASELLTVICHPKPSRSRDYWTAPMIAALSPAPIGMEIYNAHYGRRHLVYSDPNPLYTDIWDSLLSRGLRLWGFANDDSHDPPDYGSTRTMACVKDLSACSLLAALKAGRFYASTGLLLESIRGRRPGDQRAACIPGSRAIRRPGGVILKAGEGRDFSCVHAGESYIRFEAEGTDGRIFLQPFFAACT